MNRVGDIVRCRSQGTIKQLLQSQTHCSLATCSYVVQTLGRYMHAVRRRFKSSNVRWFKITNATKQLVYVPCTIFVLPSFFFTSHPNTCSNVLLKIKSKDQI